MSKSFKEHEAAVLLSKVAFATGAVSGLVLNLSSVAAGFIFVAGLIYCYYIVHSSFVSNH